MIDFVNSYPQTSLEYSVEFYSDKKKYVYVLVHDNTKIDIEISVFANLADAVECAQVVAEKNLGMGDTVDDVRQRYDGDLLYWLTYPVENHIWIVRREIK